MTSSKKTQIDPVVAAIPQPPADNAPPLSTPPSGTGKAPKVAAALVTLVAGAAYAEKRRRERMTNLTRLRRAIQSRRSPSLVARADRLRSSVR